MTPRQTIPQKKENEMKTRLLLIPIILWCAITATSAQTERRIFVAHTNDTHSCIEPVSDNFSDKNMAGKAGFMRRATLIDSLRSLHPSMLLFDCGDFSQGSVYYNLFHGEVEVKLLNHMRYDACTIGNHEFDFGLENMARLIRMSSFPWVCCNYDFTGTPCEGLVEPYVVLEREGLRIGVVGVAPRLEGLVAKHCYGNTKYTMPATALQPVVDKLRREERCDFVVCLSHLGWLEGEEGDDFLIRHTHGIDVVLGGHTHTYFSSPHYVPNSMGHEIPYNQMGKNARFVGTLEFTLEED